MLYNCASSACKIELSAFSNSPTAVGELLLLKQAFQFIFSLLQSHFDHR